MMAKDQVDNPMMLALPQQGYVSVAAGGQWRTVWDDAGLHVQGPQGERQQWDYAAPGAQGAARLALRYDSAVGTPGSYQAALAALDTVFSHRLDARVLRVHAEGRLAATLARRLAQPAGQELDVHVDAFWQQADLWLLDREAARAYPYRPAMSGKGQRHPLRPPKPSGEVYARQIPWLGKVLSFRVATIDQDVERLNRWMNNPRVAQVWEEEGDLEFHRRYLQNLIDDPHMLPLIASADGKPFGYFEVYWAKENRLGPYYDAQDYDRGWHVLIGEDDIRGRAWVTAWLPSLMHYLFLDDSRTQRIVGEPRADHHQQINNLDRCGFAKVKEFDFPHKRAMLVMLLRERFFGDRLWVPQGGVSQS
ncbi:GNAT family N-acetyltransferase [Bordetella genomosp. 13]|nr:GNAT family N-acetyltransferase [Bordetella genomosp. 13]